METALGCGYSNNEESTMTDFYSPPSSIADEEEDLNTNFSFEEIPEVFLKDEPTPLPLKLIPIETTTATPPITPLQSRQLLDPFNSFPSNHSSLSTDFLTPTSMDRYLIERLHLSNSISVPHTEINHGAERSRLYSYMNPIDDSMIKSSPCLNLPRQVQPLFPCPNHSLSMDDPWFYSEMSAIFRQNHSPNQISLSARAQQILNGNNRPLRSEKIDTEVINHLIRDANWKRQCGMKKEICVFCRNNGENELIYSSHSLKDPMGNVTCPILRAYQCPICGATGSQAHTIKYCQATGDDNHRYLPTPYEKMLRLQTLGFDDSITTSVLNQFSSPSSLYTNGWSDSYL